MAADAIERFADGVWLVDLAPLADTRAVAATVAQVLRVREDASTPVAAAPRRTSPTGSSCSCSTTASTRVGACAALAATLLAGASGLAVLATSREPLRVAGERVWALAPLAVPADDAAAPGTAPAVRLFVERAWDTRPGFAPGEGTCRRSVRCAGAWTASRSRSSCCRAHARAVGGGNRAAARRSLPAADRRPPGATAAAADAGGDDRVVVRPAWSPPSGRALRPVVGVRRRLRARRRCARVRADATDVAVVDALVAKSLVVAYDRGDATRFRMLDSIREFARDRLAAGGDATAVRDAHAAWCADLARAAHDALRGPDQAAWIGRLDAELDNLRAALGWTAGRAVPGDEALALAAKLWRYWYLDGRVNEGREHTERALAATASDAPTPARADALYAAGALAKNQSDLAEAARRLEASAAYAAQGRERRRSGSTGQPRQRAAGPGRPCAGARAA